MSHLPDELRLVLLIAVNVLVFVAAFRWIRKLTSQDWIGCTLDGLLIHYLVQYVSVCIPGLLGILNAESMLILATALAGLMLWRSRRASSCSTGFQPVPAPPGTGWKPVLQEDSPISRFDALFVCACLLFVLGYFVGLIRLESAAPLVGDDGLIYHLPSAGYWLQTGRIGLYNTWFFNPANTYSPLAGSTFFVWLIAPIRADLIAQFAQMPALILVFFAIVQIARTLGVRIPVAALAATGALLSRPFISEAILVKDDHFLAAFFLAAVAGLAPARLKDRFGFFRIGIALGLFFATKYTALLTAPLFLLAIDAPSRAEGELAGEPRTRDMRRAVWMWSIMIACVLVIAGPWYVRNWILTGNPIYPVPVSIGGFSIFKGMFFPARSTEMRTLAGAWRALSGGYNSPSPALVFCLIAGWMLALPSITRHGLATLIASPLRRLCLFGPVLGLAIFFFTSHAALIRYAYPSLLLLFICVGLAVHRLNLPFPAQMTVVSIVAGVSIYGGFESKDLLTDFLTHAVIVCAFGMFIAIVIVPRMINYPVRIAVWSIAGISSVCLVFVYWKAVLHGSRDTAMISYKTPYPEKYQMWMYIDQHVPADATIAYANLVFTRPMMGFDYTRDVIYIPTRPGVRNYHDLPSGSAHVTDQEIRAFVTHLLTENPDHEMWLSNLLHSGATYLLVGKQPFEPNPPEQLFADADPSHFVRLRDDESGTLYEIRP